MRISADIIYQLLLREFHKVAQIIEEEIGFSTQSDRKMGNHQGRMANSAIILTKTGILTFEKRSGKSVRVTVNGTEVRLIESRDTSALTLKFGLGGSASAQVISGNTEKHISSTRETFAKYQWTPFIEAGESKSQQIRGKTFNIIIRAIIPNTSRFRVRTALSNSMPRIIKLIKGSYFLHH